MSASDTGTSKQQLLNELAAAEHRCEVNAQIAEWCIELQARLWRAEAHLLHDDCRRHHATLAAEIERLRLCIKLARERRP
jgi:hypothetical protein